MTRMSRRMRSSGARREARGFTLLELLVVMTIIVIAAFAVRPNFVRTIQADRENAAVREVMGLLSEVRSEAVVRGRLARIALAPGRQEVQGEMQAPPPDTLPATRAGTEAQDYREQFDPLPVMGQGRVVLPDYVQIAGLMVGGTEAAAEQMVYFFPDGRTTGAVIRLAGNTGQEYRIELSPTTGKVQIRE